MRSALTLGLFLLFGCQTAASDVKKDEGVNTPGGSLVSLRRTACLGRCPVYRVEVFDDGRVRFEGERNVKATDPVDAQLSAEQLTALKRRLSERDFKWADYTQVSVTDLPTVELTVGAERLVHFLGDQGAPAALVKFEDDVDALVGTEKWIKGEAADR